MKLHSHKNHEARQFINPTSGLHLSHDLIHTIEACLQIDADLRPENASQVMCLPWFHAALSARGVHVPCMDCSMDWEPLNTNDPLIASGWSS